jgi:hypothetical protein
MMGTDTTAVETALRTWLPGGEAAAVAQALTYNQGDQINLRPDNFKGAQGGGRKPPFYRDLIMAELNRSPTRFLTAKQIDTLAEEAARKFLAHPALIPDYKGDPNFESIKTKLRARITDYLRKHEIDFEPKK